MCVVVRVHSERGVGNVYADILWGGVKIISPRESVVINWIDIWGGHMWSIGICFHLNHIFCPTL